jgi:hypothetical protein
MSETDTPMNKEQIVEQICSLEELLVHDNKQDKEIHENTLHQLRMNLRKVG